jgi:TonB family protein
VFETANTTVYARSNRLTVFEAVTFSLILHLAAGVVALAANIWKVDFPDQSPAMVISFVLADPTPPPPPPPPARTVAKPQTAQAGIVPPDQIVAPTVIPDEIPVVQNTVVALVPETSITGVEGGAGVQEGSADGILGGEVGGVAGGVVHSVVDARPAAGVVEFARDMPLPMFPMSQVYPSYPENARISLWEDDLVVRYVIGKDGRVKSVQVIRNPEHEIFVDGTVRAIRSWRFKPLVRDGQRQEVIHELTIQYRLHQTS